MDTALLIRDAKKDNLCRRGTNILSRLWIHGLLRQHVTNLLVFPASAESLAQLHSFYRASTGRDPERLDRPSAMVNKHLGQAYFCQDFDTGQIIKKPAKILTADKILTIAG